jgi:hypothetical protein
LSLIQQVLTQTLAEKLDFLLHHNTMVQHVLQTLTKVRTSLPFFFFALLYLVTNLLIPIIYPISVRTFEWGISRQTAIEAIDFEWAPVTAGAYLASFEDEDEYLYLNTQFSDEIQLSNYNNYRDLWISARCTR